MRKLALFPIILIFLSGCREKPAPVDTELLSVKEKISNVDRKVHPYLEAIQHREKGVSEYIILSSEQKYSTSSASQADLIRLLEEPVNVSDQDSIHDLKKILLEREAASQELFNCLNQYHFSLDTAAIDEYSEPVKKVIDDLKKFAAEAEFEINQEPFTFGFNRYANSIPAPNVIPVLCYELKAMDHLLRLLVASGADSMNSFSRDPLPGEGASPVTYDNDFVHRYPIRIQFDCSGKALAQFLRSVTDDRKFYYIFRELRAVKDHDQFQVSSIIEIARFLDPGEA